MIEIFYAHAKGANVTVFWQDRSEDTTVTSRFIGGTS